MNDSGESQFRLADARRAAMDLLARREHSVLELERKLARKGMPAELIADALDELIGDGLLDEARYAESFVAARVRKGQGPVRIRMELAERGLAPALIQRGLEAVDCDWFALAAEVRSRRFGPAPPADYPEQAKQSRFLQYRGFTNEQIRAAVGDN